LGGPCRLVLASITRPATAPPLTIARRRGRHPARASTFSSPTLVT
jgi:hypothetical protein